MAKVLVVEIAEKQLLNKSYVVKWFKSDFGSVDLYTSYNIPIHFVQVVHIYAKMMNEIDAYLLELKTREQSYVPIDLVPVVMNKAKELYNMQLTYGRILPNPEDPQYKELKVYHFKDENS